MMNCVLTQHSTVTRSRSMRSSTASASNRSTTTVGTPSSVGDTCAVQMPNPNGAGSALRNTSSSRKSPASVGKTGVRIRTRSGLGPYHAAPPRLPVLAPRGSS